MDTSAWEELINNMSHSNKMKRRKALDNLNFIIENKDTDLALFLKTFELPLASRLSDNSEINRNIACKLLDFFLKKGLKSPSLLTYVIPTLFHLLGKSPVNETCEENRQEFLSFIEDVIDVYGPESQVHINDISIILTQSLHDNCPDVIMKACDCILKLGVMPQTKFTMYSNAFVKPLLKCLSKHRLKTRIKVIKALECIFIYGDSHDFQDANTELLLHMKDIPRVRLALVEYGAALALKFKDRYSYWHKILPFLLFGLRDEDSEIASAAMSSWVKIGNQFEEENEDIRRAIVVLEDTLSVQSEGTSPKLKFGRGCCALVERGFYRMLPEILEGAQDWRPEVRLQWTKILTGCVAALRLSSLQYAAKILQALVFLASDQDPRVATECFVCVEHLGQYISPDVYIPSLQHSVWDSNVNSLKVLSTLVTTTPPKHLEKNAILFSKTMSFDHAGRPLTPYAENCILNIFKHICTYCKFEDYDYEDCLFTLFYILAKEGFSDKTKEGKDYSLEEEVLELVAKSSGTKSVEDFVSKNLKKWIARLKSTPEWREDGDPEFVVFLFLSKFNVFTESAEEVVELLRMKTGDETPPTLHYAITRTLEEVLGRIRQNNQEDLAQKWIAFLIEELFQRFLPPRQGRRTGGSLRLAAVTSMSAILETSGNLQPQTIDALRPCLVFVPALSREDAPETRVLTCHFIARFCTKCKDYADNQTTFEFMKLLTERLDDRDAKVRLCASVSLASICDALSVERRKTDAALEIMTSSSVFLLEKNENIRNNIMIVLERLGEAHPTHLKTLIAGLQCSEVIDGLKSLLLSSESK